MYCKRCERDVGAFQKDVGITDEQLQQHHAQLHVSALHEHLITESIRLQQKIRAQEKLMIKECFE